MSSKLVSVIIPTYKRPIKLRRAIESVLNQSYKNVEVIVVDDNNEGDEYRNETSKLMEFYIGDSRVKYLCHKFNMNGSFARNTGILNSSGDFLSFLDDDDYFLNDYIFNALTTLSKLDDDFGGICTGYIKSFNKLIYKVNSIQHVSINCFDLLSGNVDFAAGSTLLLRKCVVDKIGLFDYTYKKHQDWEFLIRFFRYYKLYLSPKIGVIICTDGLRNVINTNIVFSTKQKLLKDFSNDIDNLGLQKKNIIIDNQYKEMLNAYLLEKHYNSFFSFYHSHSNKICLSFHYIIKVIYYSLIGLLPSSKLLIFYLLSLKNRRYRKYLMDNVNHKRSGN